MLAAAVAGAKGRPAERLVLERDTLVKSALGPILVRRGEAFFYEHGGGQDPITVNDHLARGVLARPHTLLGFHIGAIPSRSLRPAR